MYDRWEPLSKITTRGVYRGLIHGKYQSHIHHAKWDAKFAGVTIDWPKLASNSLEVLYLGCHCYKLLLFVYSDERLSFSQLPRSTAE